jgi:hypothetical protein
MGGRAEPVAPYLVLVQNPVQPMRSCERADDVEVLNSVS